jgi:hypothetical protein
MLTPLSTSHAAVTILTIHLVFMPMPSGVPDKRIGMNKVSMDAPLNLFHPLSTDHELKHKYF